MTTPNDFKPTAYAGVLHEYAPRLKAFEYAPPSSASSNTNSSTNTLLFIGGLGDDIFHPPYVHRILAPAVYADPKLSQWRVCEVSITSSGTAWGVGNVQRDAVELAKCISYFRGIRPAGKLVLMGHSTGCQDTMYLLTKHASPPSPPLSGIILQAPVSDREAFLSLPAGRTLTTIATTLATSSGNSGPAGATILPIELTSQIFGKETPINAARWYSLTASPDPVTKHPVGDEDFFSSDIPERYLYDYTFGRLPRESTKVLVLFSEEDKWVPETVDKEELVARWVKVMKEQAVRVDEERSGVIEECSHDLIGSEESVVQDCIDRIKGFLEWVEEA